MDLIKACKQITIKQPFYGLILLSLNKYFSKNTPTACVTRNGINYEILVNPDFWNTLNDDEQIAILQHEIMHIAFKHMLLQRDFSDHENFNIATDAEINQYIENLPSNHIDYREIGKNLPPKAGTNFYYKFLKEKPKNRNIKGPENHESWKDFQDISEAEKQLIGNQTDHIVKAAAQQITKQRGTIPLEIKEYVDKLFKVNSPVFNWKSYFRRLIGFSIEMFVKRSLKKPSKRFEGAAGMKLKHKHDILVAIDTSGSVSTEEFKDFMSEIYHIYKTGAGVDIIECDARIQRIYPFKGTFDDKFHGRGGTSFLPVIEYYNKSRKAYSTLIFFTDGYAPTNFKIMKQMIWVITSNGNKNNHYPGYSIFIPENNGSK